MRREAVAASFGVLVLGAAALVPRPMGAQSPPAAAGASAALTCPSLTAPGGTAGPASASVADEPDLTVFAAASLTDAFSDLQAPWSAEHPGSTLVLSFDGSSSLRAQIEQGAPADVFASADSGNPQALVESCLALEPVTAFAGSTLVIAVPVGNPGGVVSPADLARSGVRVVGAGPDVPITGYASQVIANLARHPGYPPDFASAVAANTVSQEDNVKAVLAKVELGEADAAIVYATDAVSSTLVEAIAIPAEANVSAIHTAVRLAASAHAELAASFLDLLVSPSGQSALSRYGFLPAP